MFSIIDFKPTKNGRFRLTIETDDPEAAFFSQFFAMAGAFADALRYRFRIARTGYQKAALRPHALKTAQDAADEYLTLYRTLDGPKSKRLTTLRLILAGNGVKITIDRLTVHLADARTREKNSFRSEMKKMSESGLSVRQIAETIGKPASTVHRGIKNICGSTRSILRKTPACLVSHGETDQI